MNVRSLVVPSWYRTYACRSKIVKNTLISWVWTNMPWTLSCGLLSLLKWRNPSTVFQTSVYLFHVQDSNKLGISCRINQMFSVEVYSCSMNSLWLWASYASARWPFGFWILPGFSVFANLKTQKPQNHIRLFKFGSVVLIHNCNLSETMWNQMVIWLMWLKLLHVMVTE